MSELTLKGLDFKFGSSFNWTLIYHQATRGHMSMSRQVQCRQGNRQHLLLLLTYHAEHSTRFRACAFAPSVVVLGGFC